jgi:hypothetical protein
MRWLKIFLSSLFFVTPAIAFSQTKVTSKDFNIISATVSDWSSGAARENSEGARGVQYEIKAVAKSKMKVFIDSLVTENGTLPVEVIVGFKRGVNKDEVKKSDTIQIVARLAQSKEVRTSSKETRSAISKANKAKQFSFLLYRTKGKRCLAPIGEFKKSAREPNQ